MIPIVEELLENTIVTTLALLKANPQIIEKIFSYSNTTYSKDLREFIENNDIDVIKNFPRTSQKFPCYCIMLGEENENPESLGEFLENSSDVVSITNEYQVKKDDSGNLYIDTNLEDIVSVDVITNLTNGKEIQECAYDPNVKGRIILNEYSDVDDTVEATIGYTQDNICKSGTLMEFSYRIECWADNSNLVVYMYHLLKFIMLYKRQLLIENGLLNPIIRGSDLEPIPDYMPTFIFRRSLLLTGSIENYYDNEEIKNIFYEIDKIVVTQHLYENDKSIVSKGD
jgi:hypothetical protein